LIFLQVTYNCYLYYKQRRGDQMARGGKSQIPAKVMSGANRPNGKAFKKKPKENKSTGRTIDGYTPEKLAQRAHKRSLAS